jgi:hypothetical protein
MFRAVVLVLKFSPPGFQSFSQLGHDGLSRTPSSEIRIMLCKGEIQIIYCLQLKTAYDL